MPVSAPILCVLRALRILCIAPRARPAPVRARMLRGRVRIERDRHPRLRVRLRRRGHWRGRLAHGRQQRFHHAVDERRRTGELLGADGHRQDQRPLVAPGRAGGGDDQPVAGAPHLEGRRVGAGHVGHDADEGALVEDVDRRLARPGAIGRQAVGRRARRAPAGAADRLGTRRRGGIGDLRHEVAQPLDAPREAADTGVDDILPVRVVLPPVPLLIPTLVEGHNPLPVPPLVRRARGPYVTYTRFACHACRTTGHPGAAARGVVVSGRVLTGAV